MLRAGFEQGDPPPMIRRLVAAAGAAMVLATAPALAFDDAQKKEIGGIVAEYLREHPEVILQAIEALQAKSEAQKEEAARQAVTANRARLYEDPRSPVMGNPKGDVTLVEFFDYNCGYCKTVQKGVMQLIQDDPKLRFVFKEYPILADSSVTAAKAALAAREQGKYVEMHAALMANRGALNDETIARIAQGAGLDAAKLKADMEKPEIAATIAADKALAEELGVRGTPAFVIGDTLVPGAVPKEDLAKLIAAERQKK
jgi:protein-disulfide isomerase